MYRITAKEFNDNNQDNCITFDKKTKWENSNSQVMVGESRVLMGGRGEGGQGMMGMCLTVSHWLIPQKEKKKKNPNLNFLLTA